MEMGVGGLKLLESMAYAIMECREEPMVIPVINTLGLPLVLDVSSELIYESEESNVYFYG